MVTSLGGIAGPESASPAGLTVTRGSGRFAAVPYHAEGRGFESHHPLYRDYLHTGGIARWPSLSYAAEGWTGYDGQTVEVAQRFVGLSQRLLELSFGEAETGCAPIPLYLGSAESRNGPLSPAALPLPA
jgi:hypothetical protein